MAATTDRLGELAGLESDGEDLALILIRAASDDGRRTSLDEAITALGFDRRSLEIQPDADIASGQPDPSSTTM